MCKISSLFISIEIEFSEENSTYTIVINIQRIVQDIGIRYREKNDVKGKILIIISIVYSVVKNVVNYKSKI